MADQSFSRIYDLKTAGVDKVLADINSIIARLEILGQVKNRIADAAEVGDPAIIADLNKQYSDLVATVDKMAKSQEGLGDALAQVIELQRGITMSVKESTNALGENLVMGGRAMNATVSAVKSSLSELENMTASTSTLAERLAMVKDEITATSEQLKILGDEYRTNAINQQDYEAEAGRLTAQLIDQRVESQYLTQVLKTYAIAEDALSGSVRGARAEIALLNREQENLIVSRTKDVQITDEQIAANIARRDAIIAEKDALHDFLAANADKNLSRILNIGNYPQLTIQAEELKQRLDNLTAAGETNTEEFRQLEIESLKLAEALKAVSSSPTSGSGINTTSAQLSALKVNMAGLVVAGKEDSAEFREMQAEAQRLTAALNEVNVSIKGVATVGDKFASIVERMGLRMVANLIIFQAAIELGQALWESWTKLSDAEQAAVDRLQDYTDGFKNLQKAMENSVNKTLTEIFGSQQDYDIEKQRMLDHNNSLDDRFNAYQKMQSIAPKVLDDMDKQTFATKMNSEAIKDAANAGNSYIEVQKNLARVIESRNEQQKQELDGEKELAAAKERAIKATSSGQMSDEEFNAAVAATKGRINHSLAPENSFEKNLIDYNVIAKNIEKTKADLAKSMSDVDAFTTQRDNMEGASKDKKPKTEKEPHDYLNEQLAAHKKYYDELAKLEEADISNDQIALQQIYENEYDNLDFRLNAYRIFLDNKKKLFELSKAAEIQSDQEKLGVIESIEESVASKKAGKSYNKSYFTKNGSLGTQEQTLLDNKSGITADIAYAKAQIKNGIDQINAEAVAGTSSIVKSAFAQTISDIDDQLTQVQLKINKTYNPKERAILDSHKGSARKDELLDKTDNKKQMAQDQAEMIADQMRESEVELQIQQAHNLKQVNLESKLYKDLLALQNDYLAKKKDLKKREDSDDEKNKKIEEQASEAFVSVATSFANDYMQLLEKQDTYKQTMQQRSMDWNQKMLNSEAQSNQEKMQQDKAYYIAQQQAEKEKAITQKKRAEAQAAIDYASAALSLIPKAVKEGGVASVIIQEAALAAIFAEKEALLANAPAYAQGIGIGNGTHPGGLAWVGDGGEHEVIISPNKPTLMNLSAGTQVIPASQLGANLRAPNFNFQNHSGNNGNGNSNANYDALHKSVANIAAGLQNMQINYEPSKAVRANNKAFFKSVKI